MSVSATSPVDVWTSPASGLVTVASSWSNGLPTWGGSVLVAPATPVTLTFNVSNWTLGVVTFQGATLYLRDGSLTITTSTTLKNATITGPHALTLGGTSQVSGLTLGGGVTLDNQGVLTQSGGAVAVGTGSTIANLAGANWIDADDSSIGPATGAAGTFVNSGTLTDSDATGVTAVSVAFASTGTVSVAQGGTLVFSAAGAQTQLSGTLTGGGLVEYGPSTMATLGALTVAATNQTNLGMVNQVGTLTLNGAQSLLNRGTWNLDGDVSLLAGAGANAFNEVISSGVFAKTAGTGVSVVSASVEIVGGMNVATGTLEFTTATDAFAGAISGAGTFEIASGTAEFEPGGSNTETISVAHFLLAGGTAQIIGAVTDTGAFASASGTTLALGGSAPTVGYLTLAGTANVSGLTVTGAGELVFEAATTVAGATVGGAVEIFDRGTVTQSGGSLTLSDTSVPQSGDLAIGYGGVWNITDASGIAAGANSTHILDIGAANTAALFEKSGTGESVVSAFVMNTASNLTTSGGVTYEGVEVAAGTLDLRANIGGVGSDNIVGAGTLEFDAAVMTGQTVSFFGAGGTLAVDDLPSFNGAIVGFGASDAITVLAGTDRFAGATETATSTSLAFSNGSSPLSLMLTGDYRGDTFSATTLANGAVKITI